MSTPRAPSTRCGRQWQLATTGSSTRAPLVSPACLLALRTHPPPFTSILVYHCGTMLTHLHPSIAADAIVGFGMGKGYAGAAGGIQEPSGATAPWPGVGIYSITKGLGAEVGRIFSENTGIVSSNFRSFALQFGPNHRVLQKRLLSPCPPDPSLTLR